MRDARIEALNFGQLRLLGVGAISCGASCGAGLDSPYPKRLAQSILLRTNQSQIVLDSTNPVAEWQSINEPIAGDGKDAVRELRRDVAAKMRRG